VRRRAAGLAGCRAADGARAATARAAAAARARPIGGHWGIETERHGVGAAPVGAVPGQARTGAAPRCAGARRRPHPRQRPPSSTSSPR
jgi:hypothetical protein